MSICVSIVLIEVARPWILLNSMLETPVLLSKFTMREPLMSCKHFNNIS